MNARLAAFLLAPLLLAGCASLQAPLSAEPLDRDHGQRTLGARIEDSAIEHKVAVNISRADAGLRAARVVVVSWNGQVLLAGQVGSEDLRRKAEDTARKVRHVQHVHNELVVGTHAGLGARMADVGITAGVKLRLLFGPDVPGRRVKVVTENGVVYLMGLLTREESGLAVNAAREVYGVQKIVKIFEYIERPT